MKKYYLLLTILAFILLRIPSLFEPHWYVDEGMYATGGMVINQGGLIYRDFYDHKPQLMFYLWALLQNLGGGELLVKAKLFNIFLGIISILGINKLALYFWNKKIAAISIVVFAILVGSPILEGNIANAENLFVPLSIWAIYLALTNQKLGFFYAGLLYGIAFLIKFHPTLDFLALILFTFVVAVKKKEFKTGFRNILLSGLGFSIIQTLAVLWEFSRGNLYNFVKAAFLDAFLYAGEVGSEGILTTVLASPLFKSLLVLIVVALIISKYWKGKLKRAQLILYLLLVMQLFGVLLSGRAYGHYFLHVMFAGSIWIAITLSSPERKRILRLIFITLFVVAYFLTGYVPQPRKGEHQLPLLLQPVEYYWNFSVNAAKGDLQGGSYTKFFNYDQLKLDELTQFVEEHKIENAYIYTDVGWAYHDTDIFPPTPIFVAFQIWYQDANVTQLEIISDLEQQQTAFAIVDKDRELGWEIEDYLEQQYVLLQEGEYLNYFARVDSL